MLIPKHARREATALPIFPYPMIPMVFPLSSKPRFPSLSHNPCRTSVSDVWSLCASDNNCPITCSATASEFPSLAEKTAIPLDRQASTSNKSSPAPARAMKVNEVSVRISAVILNLLRTTNPS